MPQTPERASEAANRHMTKTGDAEQTQRPRHAHLVGLLTFTSGGVDVVALMVIGGSFTSVVTGNLIFAGRAIGTSSLNPALHAIMAVAGYVAGVAAGARLRQLSDRRAPQSAGRQVAWPRAATLVLVVEAAILAAINAAWICYGAAPPGTATDLILIAAAFSLGMQGAATRAIKGNPSTTYMTGALTALIEALATGRPQSADASAAAGLIALVAGAACGAALVEQASRAALLPPLAALLLVVVIKLRHHRAERRAQRPPLRSGDTAQQRDLRRLKLQDAGLRPGHRWPVMRDTKCPGRGLKYPASSPALLTAKNGRATAHLRPPSLPLAARLKVKRPAMALIASIIFDVRPPISG